MVDVGGGECCCIYLIEFNVYLCEVIGFFIVKDFCIWGGMLFVVEYLVQQGIESSEWQVKKVLVDCVKFVVDDFGNMFVVMWGSYICLVIFDCYFDGKVFDDYELCIEWQEVEFEGLICFEGVLKCMLESECILWQWGWVLK